MGRRAFGQKTFMEAVLDLAAGDKEVCDPVPRLATQIDKGTSTVKRYLEALERQKFVELIFGDRQKIIKLKILKDNTSSLGDVAPMDYAPKISAEPAELNPTPAPPTLKPTVETPVPFRFEKPAMPKVVVLGDYDNTEIEARSEKRELSWGNLLDEARALGRVTHAFMFYSPTSNFNPTVCSTLNHAGFLCISCPKRHKDRDSVDWQMMQLARSFLEDGDADIVVVISMDGDFDGLDAVARNHHKQIVYLKINELWGKVGGKDFVPTPVDDREIRLFNFALDSIEQGKNAGIYAGPKHIKFLQELILVGSRVSVLKLAGFEAFKDKVWNGIEANWKTVFAPNQAKTALQVLLRRGLLVSRDGTIAVNANHVAAKLVLDPTAVQ